MPDRDMHMPPPTPESLARGRLNDSRTEPPAPPYVPVASQPEPPIEEAADPVTTPPADAFSRQDTAPQPAVAGDNPALMPGMVVPHEYSRRRRRLQRPAKERREKPQAADAKPSVALKAILAGLVLSICFGFLLPLYYIGVRTLVISELVEWGLFTLAAWWYLAGYYDAKKGYTLTTEQQQAMVGKSWDTPEWLIQAFRSFLGTRKVDILQTDAIQKSMAVTDNERVREMVLHDNLIECITRKAKLGLYLRLVKPIMSVVLLLFLTAAVLAEAILLWPIPGVVVAVLWRLGVWWLIIVGMVIFFRRAAWSQDFIAVTHFMFVRGKLPSARLWFMSTDVEPFTFSVIKSVKVREGVADKSLKYGTLRVATLLDEREERLIEDIPYVPHPVEVQAIAQSRIS